MNIVNKIKEISIEIDDQESRVRDARLYDCGPGGGLSSRTILNQETRLLSYLIEELEHFESLV